jgi:S1-C subfamily serine protease
MKHRHAPITPSNPSRVALIVAFISASLGGIVQAQPAGAKPVDPFVTATKEIRPSVVAVGSYLRTDTPTVKYFGTGFVVADGLTVVTNAHVVEALRQQNRLDQLRVYFPDTRDVDGREAKVLMEDKYHDVALIQFTGKPARPLKLATEDPDQGTSVGMLGYPIGTMLGLVPAVHKGVVAAVVPAVLPLPVGVKMTPELQTALKNPYNLYQLDMVAFPGNSGSPLYDAGDGTVIGIVNMTLATKTREHLFDKPTGIAYAVPVRWIHDIIRRSKAEAGR